jgi:hypothetical protein
MCTEFWLMRTFCKNCHVDVRAVEYCIKIGLRKVNCSDVIGSRWSLVTVIIIRIIISFLL